MNTLAPDTAIHVIVGHDNFDHESYIKDVALSSEEAYNLIRNIKPNGSLADSYHVTAIKLCDLQNGENSKFDPIDVQLILGRLIDLGKPEHKLERVLNLLSSKDLLDTYDKVVGSTTRVEGLLVTKDQLREKLLGRLI